MAWWNAQNTTGGPKSNPSTRQGWDVIFDAIDHFIKLTDRMTLLVASNGAGQKKEWIYGFKFPGKEPLFSLPWKPTYLTDAEHRWLRVKPRTFSYLAEITMQSEFPASERKCFCLHTAFRCERHYHPSPASPACWPCLMISHCSFTMAWANALRQIHLCLPAPSPILQWDVSLDKRLC